MLRFRQEIDISFNGVVGLLKFSASYKPILTIFVGVGSLILQGAY